jgi:hypothetical protein
MYPTIEVRWFQHGQIPPEVRAWYGRIGPLPEEQPIRVDHYLHLPDHDSLGIKLREGRLEIKQRQRQVGVVRFDEQLAGLVERWRKWSFSLAHNEPTVPEPNGAWIAVEKRRRLRRYRVTADRQVEVASAEPAQGCELELSRIKAADQQWWSLCFEAFGDEATLQENLRQVVNHVLAASEPPILKANASCGYPVWLRLVTKSIGI